MSFGVAAIKGIKGLLGADNALKSPTITKAGNCFVAGTEILTVDGIKNIEDLRVGDWVIADDPTTPRGIEARQVLETFIIETDALYDLYVDGEVISTTGEHPFWVPDKGWVKASDLAVGSLLQTDEETFVDLDKIERREGNFKVYNFEIEGFPTYFVSELGILVHNTCGGDFDSPNEPIGKLRIKDDKWLKNKGIDPHDLKRGLPGSVSEFDIYTDEAGNLWAQRKPKYVQDTKPEYLGNLDDY